MTDLARLTISVESDADRATRDLRGLEGQSQRTERAVDRLGSEARETGEQTERMGRGANVAARGLRLAAGAAGAFVAALGAREILRTADSIEQLRGRINLYTASAIETEQVISALFDRSRQLGASFNGLASTYARLAPAQEQLNLSTGRMLDLTEAIGTAFVVSGASAQEAENAILQLSQAFASGELRGEELRSVMEQGQRVMIGLSNQLGRTTGELREMAEAGQLTADVVADALLKELPKLRDEAGELPVTIGRGFESLRSAVGETVGILNTMTGVTSAIGEGFQSFADTIGEFNDRLNETDVEKLERVVAAGQVRFVGQDSLESAWSGISGAVGMAAGALGDFANAAEDVEDTIRARLLTALVRTTVDFEATAEANREATEELERLREEAEASAGGLLTLGGALEGVGARATGLLSALGSLTERLPDQRVDLAALRDLWGELPDLWDEAGEKAADLAEDQAEAARELANLREEQELEIAQLERLNRANLISEEAYDAAAAAIARENEVRAAGLTLSSDEGKEMMARLQERDQFIDSIERSTTARKDEAEAMEAANEARERTQERAERDLEKYAREVERTSAQIADLIGEGLFEGFDSVLPRIERLLQNWAAQLILQPIINPIVGGMGGGFGGGMGQLGGGGPLGMLASGASGQAFGGSVGGGGMLGFGGVLSGFYDASINMAGVGAQAGYGISNLLGLGQGATATLGNIGGTIGAAGPGAFIGSSIAKLLGAEGSGNGLIDGGLSLGGSVIGGAIGGPIGSAIGAALGQTLAGVFKDEDFPYARSDIAIRNGRAVTVGGESLDGGGLSGAEKGVVDAITAALSSLGVGSDFTGGGTTFGVASGRSGALGDGFFAGSGGGFAGGATFTNIEDPKEAAERAVAFALSQAIGNGAIQLPDQLTAARGQSGFDASMEIFERNDFDIDASLADLNFAQNFEDALSALEGSTDSFGDSIRANVTAQIEQTIAPLREFRDRTEELGLTSERSESAIASFVENLLGLNEGESLNQAEAAIEAVNAKFDALAEAATEFGISAAKVEDGRAKALADLEGDFLASLEAASLQVNDRGFILEGRALFDQIDALRDQAITYGEGYDEVGELGRDMLAKLLEGLDAGEIEALRADLGSKAASYGDVFERALASISGEGGAIDVSADALREFTSELEAQIRGLSERGPGGEINRILREYTEGVAQASALGADSTLLLRRAILDLQRTAEGIDPSDFDAITEALDDFPDALGPAGDALRGYVDEIEAATQAQTRAASALSSVRSEIEAAQEFERLEAQRIAANESLADAVFNSQAARLREQSALQDRAASERSAQLQQEAQLFENAARSLERLSADLGFSSVSPIPLLEQLEAAQAQFDATLSAARGGDGEAAANLAGDAQRLLDLNAQVNRSGVAGSSLFEDVRAAIDEVGGAAGGRAESLRDSASSFAGRSASAAEAQLDELRDLLGITDDGFGGVRSAVERSAELAAASGQTLEEFLASNSAAFDVLENGGFADAESFARSAFDAALESLGLAEEREAMLREAEKALESANQALDALLQGEGLEARFKAILAALTGGEAVIGDGFGNAAGAIEGGGDVVAGALGGAASAISGAAGAINAAANDAAGRLDGATRDAIDRIEDAARRAAPPAISPGFRVGGPEIMDTAPLPETVFIGQRPGSGGGGAQPDSPALTDIRDELRRLREENARDADRGNRISAELLDRVADAREITRGGITPMNRLAG